MYNCIYLNINIIEIYFFQYILQNVINNMSHFNLLIVISDFISVFTFSTKCKEYI